MEMSGSTQRRYSEMSGGESNSWLEGISELTKSEGIQAVRYRYMKEGVFRAGTAHGPCIAQ